MFICVQARRLGGVFPRFLLLQLRWIILVSFILAILTEKRVNLLLLLAFLSTSKLRQVSVHRKSCRCDVFVAPTIRRQGILRELDVQRVDAHVLWLRQVDLVIADRRH